MSYTKHNLPELEYKEEDYFTEQDILELREFEEEKHKEGYLLKELLLTDIELLTI